MANKRKSVTQADRPASRTAPAQVESNTSLDVDALRNIVEILEASEVTRLVWRKGEERLYIRRGSPTSASASFHSAPMQAAPSVAVSAAPAPVASAAAPPPAVSAPAAPAAAAQKPGHVVTSPFVGTFYRSPAPDQPSFVEVGSLVKKGQALCIIEAMKLMNEIESEVEGRIAEVLAENGQPVEFSQPLFRIEKA